MLNDSITLTGSVKVVLTGPDGKIKQQHEDHNLVVKIGRAHV